MEWQEDKKNVFAKSFPAGQDGGAIWGEVGWGQNKIFGKTGHVNNFDTANAPYTKGRCYVWSDN